MTEEKKLSTPYWQRIIWSVAAFGMFGIATGLLFVTYFTISGVLATIAGRNPVPTAGVVTDPVFTFVSLNVVSGTLIRLVACLIGAGIAFGGLAVSFFAHDSPIHVSGQIGAGGKPQQSAATGRIATHVPGVIAIVLGVALVAVAVLSKTANDYTWVPEYAPACAYATDDSGKHGCFGEQTTPIPKNYGVEMP